MNSTWLETLKPSLYSKEDFALINFKSIPKHIAIVMDGNRRWAQASGQPTEAGHWQGAEKLELVVRGAAELGVKALTVYSFSTENWERSRQEVDLLMKLFKEYLINKREILVKEGIRLHTIGDLSRFPQNLQLELDESKKATKKCGRIDLILALNYGGRDEIRRAMVKMSDAEKKGKLQWKYLTEKTISSYLDTAQWPDPELFIRPSGVHRMSNFLIWQGSYSEIVVTKTLWPDFSPQDLLQAVIEYQGRKRRFGA